MHDYLTIRSNGFVTYCDGLIASIQADQARAYLLRLQSHLRDRAHSPGVGPHPGNHPLHPGAEDRRCGQQGADQR